MRKIIFLIMLLQVNILNAATTKIEIPTASGKVCVSLCSPSVFRIQLAKDGKYSDDEKWMVRKYEFAEVRNTVEKKSNTTTIATDSLRIIISNGDFALMVMDIRGNILFNQLAANIYATDSTVNLNACLNPAEHFFGFGERMDNLDQRGKLVKLNVGLGNGLEPAVGGKDILEANYCPVPMFLSTQGYGLFFHTPYATEWDMGWSNSNTYTVKAANGMLDYYFFYGPSFYTIIDHYTDITGKSPMLPRFAMGLHLGTYSGGTWKNEQQTSDRYPVELTRRMRSEGIPFDLLWLDSTWRLFCEKHGNGGCCFEWRETFKDPAAMFRDVYAEHVSMFGLHIRSYLDNGPKYKLLDAAKKKGNILYRNEDIVDFFNPKAVNWWFKNCVMKVADIGCKFVKTDVGSALRDKEHPEMHNIFTLAYAEAPFEKFHQLNKMRGLTHTREGYAGIQRYPYIWAGDWGSEWQWFEPLIVAGMNIGMSGVGNWTHCMGGFEQYSSYDTELYVRWCQFGLFSPIAMLFGMDHPRYHEPWTYGKEAMENFIKYDSLRYTLIPYIYTAEYENHHSGRPLMTPLVMDYPKDENTYHVTRQYMFGPSMMICPVTTKGALSQTVYFPHGRWIDYNTGERIDGRLYKSFLTPLDVLPIYIKAGAIIPQQPAMQYYKEKPIDFITLDIYPEGTSSYSLYEDDGISDDYLQKKCALTHIKSELDVETWKLEINKPSGTYTPEEHGYKVKAFLDASPKKVFENGNILSMKTSLNGVQDNPGWYFDSATHRLYILLNGNNKKDITVKVHM